MPPKPTIVTITHVITFTKKKIKKPTKKIKLKLKKQ